MRFSLKIAERLYDIKDIKPSFNYDLLAFEPLPSSGELRTKGLTHQSSMYYCDNTTIHCGVHHMD